MLLWPSAPGWPSAGRERWAEWMSLLSSPASRSASFVVGNGGSAACMLSVMVRDDMAGFSERCSRVSLPDLHLTRLGSVVLGPRAGMCWRRWWKPAACSRPHLCLCCAILSLVRCFPNCWLQPLGYEVHLLICPPHLENKAMELGRNSSYC